MTTTRERALEATLEVFPYKTDHSLEGSVFLSYLEKIIVSIEKHFGRNPRPDQVRRAIQAVLAKDSEGGRSCLFAELFFWLHDLAEPESAPSNRDEAIGREYDRFDGYRRSTIRGILLYEFAPAISRVIASSKFEDGLSREAWVAEAVRQASEAVSDRLPHITDFIRDELIEALTGELLLDERGYPTFSGTEG